MADEGRAENLKSAVAGQIDRAGKLCVVLEKVKQACLFADDDGRIGVTTDPHISEALFDEICEALQSPPKS